LACEQNFDASAILVGHLKSNNLFSTISLVCRLFGRLKSFWRLSQKWLENI
jgi:hypothetical protein